VLVLSHVIWQSSPHVTSQFGPLEQANVQWSVHVALQSLPKLLHVGAHGDAPPQSRLHVSPPWQAQDEPVHGGPAACDEHATSKARTEAVRSRRRVTMLIGPE
jgi:hypothetical protein